VTAARIAIATVIACAGCARTGGEPSLVDVTRGDLVVTVEVTGTLRAVDATPIHGPTLPGISGVKLAWMAPEGSEVAPGHRLLAFDASDLDSNLEAARGEADQYGKRIDRKHQELALARRDEQLRLLQAESDARKAALKIEVPSELVRAIDRKEQQLDRELADRKLDQTRREIEVSRHSGELDLQYLINTRDAARRRIDELERSRPLLTITAPRAGTVVYGSGRGDAPSVGETFWHSAVILQVVGLDAMTGDGTIDEIDVGRVAVHQPVTLRLEALPDLALRGSVASIATSVVAASSADPNKLVQLQIAIPPTAGAGLRPGMRFRGEIEVERVAGAIQVPADAVFVTPDGPIAYRDTAHGLERVALRLGQRTAEAIEVEAGLAAGDRVSRVDPEQEVP
jgi:HlyD family secretion protein